MAIIGSSMEGQYITGTVENDSITVYHRDCKAYGEAGNDRIISYTDNCDLYGGGDNDFLHAYGNFTRVGSYDYTMGDDTLVSQGIGNDVTDTLGSNLFIIGGDANTATGGIYADTFCVYSYSGRGTNVSLTGGGNNDSYVISTGLVSVDGASIFAAPYNPSDYDFISATISDFDAFDTLYIRDYGLSAINPSVTGGGVLLMSNTGRVNVLLSGQSWEAVKNARITCDDAQGNISSVTLEQASDLSQNKAPAGISVSGDYLNISAGFTGNLLMSGQVNYVNDNIVTIDATANNQAGMLIAGNANTNVIYAGNGGNVLWGGSGFTTNDYLFGGAGADVFMTGKNDGTDLVFDTDVNDTVSLYETNLSDLVNIGINADSIVLVWNTGNVTAFATSGTLTPKIQFADGSSWRFNRASGNWQGA